MSIIQALAQTTNLYVLCALAGFLAGVVIGAVGMHLFVLNWLAKYGPTF